MKKQMKVLKEIYLGKGDQTVEELSKNTDLTKRQVHNALTDLERRKLIKKTKESNDARFKVPPTNKIFVKINKEVTSRIKSLLAKAEQEKNGSI